MLAVVRQSRPRAAWRIPARCALQEPCIHSCARTVLMRASVCGRQRYLYTSSESKCTRQLSVLRWRAASLVTRRPFRSPAASKLDETTSKLDETAATVVGLAESMSKMNTKVTEDIRGLAANLDSSIKVLKAQTAAVQKSSADPLLKNKIYWLMHNRPVLPTNEAGFDNRVVGIGFEAYYNEYFAPLFTCVYSVAGDKGGKLTVSTPGKVLAGRDYKSYSISCASPQYVPAKRTYTLAVFYEDADGKR